MRTALRLGTACFGVAAILTVAAAFTSSSVAASRISGDCTDANARQLIADHDLNDFLLPNPVLQLLCGPFTGAGSQAMAIVIGPLPTCWITSGWVVFTFTCGDWKLVLNERLRIVPPLVAVAGGIRETAAVFRANDTHCLPTGGTHARVWRWNGTGLVADAWKQMTAGKPLEAAQVYTPSANIECSLTDSPQFGSEVFCQTVKPPRWVRLGLNGSLKICRGGLRCTSDFGETPTPRKLVYGAQVTVGRFRCFSLRSGMRCVVTRTGKGFLINAAAVARVG
jgi:hypothetical protein